MKVTVRIHRENGAVEFKTRKLRDDGRVLLRKRGKGQEQWAPKVTWTETKHLFLNRVKYFTDVFPEALETFQMNAKTKTIEKPELSQEDTTRYAKSKVFEKRYMTEPKPSSTFLYVLLVFQIVTIVLMFLLNSGRLRI